MMKLSEWLEASPRKKLPCHKKAVACITSKSDPRYRLYVSGCLSKKWFASKDDVAKFLAESGYGKCSPKNLYAYKCKFCDGWHFTSKKMYAPKGAEKCFSKRHLVARRLSDKLDAFSPDSWGWAKTKKLLKAMLVQEEEK